METAEWVWLMDYCKKHSLPPTEKWAWEQAKAALKAATNPTLDIEEE